jgi:hypothetical protein
MPELRLEIVEGQGAGTAVPLDGSMVIGGSEQADLPLADARVSEEHARVTVSDDGGGDTGVVVEDLRSSNGTFVNGQKVDRPTWLLPGDELMIGVTIMTLRGGPGDQPAGFDAASYAYRLPVRPPGSEPEVLLSDRRTGPRELLALLDVNVKRRAHNAPGALLALVLAIVVIYLMSH